MQMVKIHIPEQRNQAKAFVDLVRRGRVTCLPNDVFVVPQPALQMLRDSGIAFEQLDHEGNEQ